jgi:lipopolysaccharide transport system permease protein
VSAVVVGLVEFLISFLILLGLMIHYSYFPKWQVVFLPFFVLVGFLAALGPSLWIGAMNVKYRDFSQVVPFLVQFGLYVSPVGFSSQMIPDKWKWLYSLNPMVGVIDGFRWSLLGGGFEVYWPGFLISMLGVLFFLIFGMQYFRKTEKDFADLI